MSDLTSKVHRHSSREFSQPLPQTLKVWVYQDDRAGHISQLKGLLSSLSKETKIEQRWIDAQSSKFKFSNLITPLRTEDSPDIVIGAGHSTHKSILLAARAHKAFSFVIMKPSLPLTLFDGVICPEHDGLKANERIFNSQGPISKATTCKALSKPHDRHQHLFLIGGPSKHFVWNEDLLLEQIRTICLSNPELDWLLSNSPRTPKGFLDKLRHYQLPNLSCYHYHDERFGDISKMLLASKFTWVTPDSMSMIYESLSAGSPTALLTLEAHKARANKRICRHISNLLETGPVVGFDKWQTSREECFYPPKVAPLNEAERAAKWLLARYQQLKAK